MKDVGQKQDFIWIMPGLLLLAGCAAPEAALPRDPLTPNEFSAPLQTVPAAFERTAACTPLTSYAPPAAGTRFVYRRRDGSTSERQIISSTGSRVTFRYHLKGAAEALPPQFVESGFLVGGAASGSARQLSYGTSPAEVLAGLQPGETVTIPTTEKSNIGGKELTLELPTLIKFEGCGRIDVAGQGEDVRIYRVSRGRRVRSSAGDDRVLRTRTAYYLSSRHGFPLALEDDSVTVVAEITAPTNTDEG